MLEQDAQDTVKNVLKEEFEVPEELLTSETELYQEMGLDSLDSVDLVVALEKAFDFKIVRSVDEERIRAIRTLGDLYAFIESKRD
ncbi:MAG: acyl carrier protein [Candidatus Sumerlaeota bacterium]